MLIKFIIAVIFVEAITELVVKGKIFRPVKDWLMKLRPEFFGELLVCGYCVAFWGSLISVPIFSVKVLFNGFGGYVVAIFLVHRCATHLHNLTHLYIKHKYDKLKERVNRPEE